MWWTKYNIYSSFLLLRGEGGCVCVCVFHPSPCYQIRKFFFLWHFSHELISIMQEFLARKSWSLNCTLCSWWIDFAFSEPIQWFSRRSFAYIQKPKKNLFQIIRSLWNDSLINMHAFCGPWIQARKILQSYFKEPAAFRVSVRERKIRLFLPRRKNLFNPYLHLPTSSEN